MDIPPTANRPISHSIADVERDTGLSKDTLRVWERRYGFPTPTRDQNDERVYDNAQVHRLRLIRRLMDSGLRPGKLVAASLSELEAQLAACQTPTDETIGEAVGEILRLTCERQLAPLRVALSQTLARQGLQRFVIDTLPAVLVRLGDGWLGGTIGVAEEHLLTEALQNLLRSAVHSFSTHALRHPVVLLTTLPDEDHGLGLLMVQALLESEQATTIPLGLRTPINDIVATCEWAKMDVVALSVSSAYAPRKALQGILTLRQQLPPEIELWVGGGGVLMHRDTLVNSAGLRCVTEISDVLELLAQWRLLHAP